MYYILKQYILYLMSLSYFYGITPESERYASQLYVMLVFLMLFYLLKR